MDFIFSDGTTLRDSGSVDQWGYSMHPAARGQNPNITPGSWNFIMSNIGERNAGKTVTAIMVAYDQPPQTGAFSAHFASIWIGHGS